MIKALAIRNFKNLERIPEKEGEFLQFSPINVLIGPNGCGKSSLLQAVDFLRAFFESSVEVYLKERGWEYRDIPNLRQARKKIRWELKAELDDDEHGVGAGEYHYTVALGLRRYVVVDEEKLCWTPRAASSAQVLLERKGRTCRYLNRLSGTMEDREIISLPASVMSRWDPTEDRAKYPQAIRFRKWIERFRSYLIWDPKVLRNPDRGKHDEIGQSGEHLASVLGRLRDKNREAFGRLEARLKRLFPTLSHISVSGGGWGWRTIRLHEGNGKQVVFNSQQMSDGVLRLLAVTSLLYIDRIPSVLTFEEPENGVHPQLLHEVVQVLRELTLRKPPNKCQVFLTTHSPYVLDEFFDHPEEVFCMERPGPQAGARIVRLSDNKQLDNARQTFSQTLGKQALGEAWFNGILGATAR
ncbi:MAG: AAA family ATPase [Planctomycetota bacterium]|nr:AAA family ATPase [Planctomycetota bacterium]